MLKISGLVFLCVVLVSLVASMMRDTHPGVSVGQGWWTARHDSSGQAPDPGKMVNTAIVQIYDAATYGWRGKAAVHPWIIFKRAGDTHYTRYEVTGWGSGDRIRKNSHGPDDYWFGAKPHLLVDYRGPEAASLIPQIEAAIASYPWKETYHAWPGPNSNTFMAHIGRNVPALHLNMPANAIGKDYRDLARPIGLPPSGQGVQISLLGLIGFTAGPVEGVEINLLGIDMGMQFSPFKLRLPFIGSINQGSVQNTTSQPE